MGQEHMAYLSAGGVAYQRSFSRGVSPTGGLGVCVCVCIYYLMELLGTWQDHTRQGTSSNDGWSGHVEALEVRPSLQLQSACATDAHQSRSASIDAGLAQGAVAGCETTFPHWGASRNTPLPMQPAGWMRACTHSSLTAGAGAGPAAATPRCCLHSHLQLTYMINVPYHVRHWSPPTYNVHP